MGRFSLPPGPRLPAAVQTARWLRKPLEMMDDCFERFGDTFTLKFVHEGTFVFVTKHDSVKQVFRGDPSVLHGGEGKIVLMPVLGRTSMMLADGDAHMRQRRLILPAFAGERMRSYEEAIRDITERTVAQWPLNRSFELHPQMQDITLDVIIRAVFGVEQGERLDELRRRIVRLLHLLVSSRRLPLLVAAGPKRVERWRKFRAVRDPVHAMLDEEIELRREAEDLEDRDDVLSILLSTRDEEDGSPLSQEELRDALMTMLLVGHETTANSLAWTLERLMRHPEAMERTVADAQGGDGAYVEAVLKEVQRLCPVTPIALRRLMEPYELEGYRLPAGAHVAPCIYLVHRRPELYPDPQAFRPERFVDQREGTYTWIPFGGGVRRCPGAGFAIFEMSVILQAILRHVRLRADDPEPEPLGRRLIFFTPGRGATAVAEPQAVHA
jgi:cytochrome P450 family 135